MPRSLQFTAQLIADLFVAIDDDDPIATFAAARALAARIGEPATLALARALLADHRNAPAPDSLVIREQTPLPVSCA